MSVLKEKFLGVNVSPFSYEETISKLLNNIEYRKKSFIVAINPEKIMKAQDDIELMDLLNSADFQIPDGIGVVIASRIKGGRIRQRVTGIDMMLELCRVAAENDKAIFLYGGKPGIAEEAKQELVKMYRELKVVGVIDGYEKNEQAIIETINLAKPDIIFVALGSPGQEYWITKNMQHLYPSVYQGVGGSFDVISGKIKRAPVFFQKLGLEWLYRLFKEPSRWKRQLILPKFLLRMLKN